MDLLELAQLYEKRCPKHAHFFSYSPQNSYSIGFNNTPQCVNGQKFISNRTKNLLILEGAHRDQLHTSRKLGCILQPPLSHHQIKFITVIHEILFKIMASPPLRGRKADMVVELKGVTLPPKVLFKFISSYSKSSKAEDEGYLSEEQRSKISCFKQ